LKTQEQELQEIFGDWLEEQGFVAGMHSIRRRADSSNRTIWFKIHDGMIKLYGAFIPNPQLTVFKPLRSFDMAHPNSFGEVVKTLNFLFSVSCAKHEWSHERAAVMLHHAAMAGLV
jgi:hypothetical protein